MFNVVLRRRVLIATLSLAFGALWVTLALVAPRTWTSQTAFMSQSRQGAGNLPGVVAQLGINLGGGEGAMSPDFYVDLVSSRTVLGAVVQDTFAFRDADGQAVRGNVADFYEIERRTPELEREEALRWLRQDIAANANIKTGVVTVRVSLTQPEMAHQVADRILAEVQRFNLESRQQQAAADREFAAERLEHLAVELRNAEDRLQGFMEANRNTQAPRVAMQLDRLRRDVAMQQSLYTALAQSYGQARIEEVRDTPVIATVETPEVPVMPDKRGLPVKLLIGLLLGAMLGTILAFALDYFSRSRDVAPDEFEEFARLRRAAIADALHPWRPLGRAFRRGS